MCYIGLCQGLTIKSPTIVNNPQTYHYSHIIMLIEQILAQRTLKVSLIYLCHLQRDAIKEMYPLSIKPI